MTKAMMARAEALERWRAVGHRDRLVALVEAVEAARVSGGLDAVLESEAWCEARRFKREDSGK